MGFNISGIAINKNYNGNMDALFQAWGWKAHFDSEIDYATAVANWKDEKYCDVYFTEKGTLLFTHMTICASRWKLENTDVLTFGVSETSMVFSIRLYSGKELRRELMEVEGNRFDDEGDPLASEEGQDDTMNLTFAVIGEVIGKSFWSIDFEEAAQRYVLQDTSFLQF